MKINQLLVWIFTDNFLLGKLAFLGVYSSIDSAIWKERENAWGEFKVAILRKHCDAESYLFLSTYKQHFQLVLLLTIKLSTSR